ncbi:hypothetical protein TNCV_2270551 [Trichonephila clavipes]|nr:hypothetical protein TNCV_2270551 [Trichonephila clavipes]
MFGSHSEETFFIGSVKGHYATHPIQWLATLTAVTYDQNSNSKEKRDFYKCIVFLRLRSTLSIHRATSPLWS